MNSRSVPHAQERSYKTHAVVLRARNLGEADKIYTLFTDADGKLDAVAKGVRRARSHVAGKLEFMCEATLTMHRGRSLDVIASAEIARAHWAAIVNPGGFAVAHLLAELVDAFCETHLPMPEVFELLRGALRALGAAQEPASLVPRFELRLLGALGFAPAADACVRCGAALDGQPSLGRSRSGRPRLRALPTVPRGCVRARAGRRREFPGPRGRTRRSRPAGRARDAVVRTGGRRVRDLAPR